MYFQALTRPSFWPLHLARLAVQVQLQIISSETIGDAEALGGPEVTIDGDTVGDSLAKFWHPVEQDDAWLQIDMRVKHTIKEV